MVLTLYGGVYNTTDVVNWGVELYHYTGSFIEIKLRVPKAGAVSLKKVRVRVPGERELIALTFDEIFLFNLNVIDM